MSEGDKDLKGSSAGYIADNPYAAVTVQYGSVRYVPAEPAKPEPKARSGDRLKGLVDGVGRLRSLFFDILFLILVAFLAALAIYLAFTERKLIVEPIKAPAMLSQLGYSGEVAADRLVDAINGVEQAAKVRRNNLDVIPRSRNVNISVPEVGTLFDTSLFYLKKILSRQDIEIAGEFICTTQDCDRAGIYLRLRILGGMDDTVDFETIGEESGFGWEDRYFRKAAVDVLELIEPYMAAAYYYDREPERASRIIRRVLRVSDRSEERALAFNLSGVMALYNSDEVEAIRFFKKAVDEDPDLAEAYSNWGNALLKEHRIEDAIAKYEQAIDIDPEFASAHANIADAYMRSGRIEEAIDKYNTAIAIDPEIAYAYANLGDAYAQTGDRSEALGDTDGKQAAYAKAFGYFREATEIEPDLVFAHVSWGNALARLDRVEEARDRLETARILATTHDIPNPDGTLAYVDASLGDLYSKTHKNDLALRHYRLALEKRKDNLQALAGAGDMLMRKRDYDEAITYYSQAIDRNSDFARAFVGLGDAYFRKGDLFYAQASAAYTRAHVIKPDNYLALEGLGNIAVRQKDFADASTRYAEAIRQNVKAANSYAGLAYASYRLKDCDTAATNYDTATQLASVSAYMYRDWRAILLGCKRFGDVPDAMRRWAEASPDAAEPQFLLADAYLRLGATYAAAERYRSVVRIDPDYQDASTVLADLNSTFRTPGPK